jgi:trimethylamine--corrinoid protein Co-methyltransferase
MALVQPPKFLSRSDMERLHEGSLTLLEKKGIVFDLPEAVELFEKAGARVEGKTVFIPRSLVESSLKQLPSTFRMEAVNPSRSVTIGQGLCIHPAGGEVFLLTRDNQRRQATLSDYGDFQKVYQSCPNMDMTGYQPLSPMDVPKAERGLRCLYETMLYTDKPWLCPMDYVDKREKERLIGMYQVVFGKDYVDSHYVTWNVVCPESPLVFCAMACEGILTFSAFHQPTVLVSAPMSGITSPIQLFGTILLQNTETLAGICLSQLVCPGVPVLPSASLTYGNLKLATWECACPDTAVMLAGAVQMYKEFYGLPARAQTGVTSAKCLDYQAGYETMQSLLTTALMGVNVTSQSAGSLENLLTVSLEKTVMDDEIISRVRRISAGIDTSEAAMALDAIMETDHGKDFLMHDDTIELMHDSWKETVADWNNYDRWSKRPDRDILDRANNRVKEILASAQAPLLEPDAVAALDRYLLSNT